jgi:hypothetical protein
LRNGKQAAHSLGRRTSTCKETLAACSVAVARDFFERHPPELNERPRILTTLRSQF